MPHDTTILRQICDQANRANPWPLWATLRETPVCWQEDALDDAGAYVVSTYRDVEALFHDPRLSSDERNSRQTGGRPIAPDAPDKFINLDPPRMTACGPWRCATSARPNAQPTWSYCGPRSSAS